jgi:hypothetical protein
MTSPAAARPASIGRSILAVVTGFLVIGVLAFGTGAVVKSTLPGAYAPDGIRMVSTSVLILTQVYVIVYAVFGCWLAARMAPSRPMAHALALGVLGLAFNLVGGTMTGWSEGPAWYYVVALLLVMPAAWLGGAIAERRTGAVVAAAA